MTFTVKNKATGRFAKVSGVWILWVDEATNLTSHQVDCVKNSVNENRLAITANV